MSFIAVTKSQMEVLESDERLLVVEAEPGAGLSWALCMKSIKEAQEGKFVGHCLSCAWVVDSGGHLDIFRKILTGFNYRYSEKSKILTIGEGRIKILPAGESHVGQSFDMVISDRCSTLQMEDIFNPRNVTLGVHANQEGFWDKLQQKRIKMKLDDNIFFCDDKYKNIAREVLPERFFK